MGLSFQTRSAGAEQPEYMQRIARARQHNQRAADLRILDREFYKNYRKFIRIPVNVEEKARNARWARLNNTLHMASWARWSVKPSIAILRAQRATLGLRS